MFWKNEYIEYLKKEIEWLKSQVEREKKRADLAVDALLTNKANSQPIMPEKYDIDKLLANAVNSGSFVSIKNEIENVGKEVEQEKKLEKEEYK